MSQTEGLKNLVQMVRARASELGTTELMSFLDDSGNTESQMNFQELDQAALKIAQGLVERGLKGRNLLLLYAPGIDYVKAFFGCLYAGCVPVPAYPPMGARDIDRLERVMRDSEAAAILSSKLLLPMIENWVNNSIAQDTLLCLATDLVIANTNSSNTTITPHDPEPDDIAFLQYTSGSTGHPKGVMITHRNLLANFRHIIQSFFGTPDKSAATDNCRIVIWLPPFHDMGLIGGILTPIYIGGEVTLMSPLTFLKNPYLWLKTMSDNKAHVSGGPNFAYEYCTRKITQEQSENLDLSHWDVAFNGAEPIQGNVLSAFSKRFQANGFRANAFLPCYGLAEATLFVAGTPRLRGSKSISCQLNQLEEGLCQQTTDNNISQATTLVSSGVASNNVEIRIVDAATRTACAPGKVGEIWVSSESVAAGYWNKPNFSDSVFRATITDEQDDKTYLRTGDLGSIVDSELVVTGRIKELIIIAGRNHYPQDIEQSLQASNPLFRKGCGAAFSVTENGKELLAIMQEVSTKATDAIDYKQLALSASRAIGARHGVTPKIIVFITSGMLNKTSSGKIQRAEAKRIYTLGNFAPLYVWNAEQQTTVPRKPPSLVSEKAVFTDWQTELYVEMQGWVSTILDTDPHNIDLDVTFSELGVDSIEAIDLVDQLQTRIERTVNATELLRYPTVKALVDHFASELMTRDHAEANSK